MFRTRERVVGHGGGVRGDVLSEVENQPILVMYWVKCQYCSILKLTLVVSGYVKRLKDDLSLSFSLN